MEYTRIKTCNDKGDPIHISRNDIITASSSLKRRKAPGADNITNEHVLHAGSLLVDCLCKLYMLVVSHHNGSTDLLYRFTKEDPNPKTLVTVTALLPFYRVSLKSSKRSFLPKYPLMLSINPSKMYNNKDSRKN